MSDYTHRADFLLQRELAICGLNGLLKNLLGALFWKRAKLAMPQRT